MADPTGGLEQSASSYKSEMKDLNTAMGYTDCEAKF